MFMADPRAPNGDGIYTLPVEGGAPRLLMPKPKGIG